MKWLCSSSHAPIIKSTMPLSVHHDEGLYKVVMRVKFAPTAASACPMTLISQLAFEATNDRLLFTMN